MLTPQVDDDTYTLFYSLVRGYKFDAASRLLRTEGLSAEEAADYTDELASHFGYDEKPEDWYETCRR